MQIRKKSVSTPATAAIVSSVLAAAIAAAVLLHRAPPGTVVRDPLGTDYHSRTVWTIEPSYEADALCFINYFGGDPFYAGLFSEDERADFAAFSARIAPADRRRVERFRRVFTGAGVSPSTSFLGLWAVSGCPDLERFRDELSDPARLRRERAADLDIFYRFRFGGWRLPGFVFDLACRELAAYLDTIDRAGFRSFWETSVRPELAALASELGAGTARLDVIPIAEALAGGSLTTDRIRVRLARFARPNGITLGGADLVMEERTDALGLARIACHEALHHKADWTGNAELAAVVRAAVGDPLFRERFKARDRRAGYNTPVALVEEDLTRALDQIAAERLAAVSRSAGLPAAAPDARERWFFEDGGMHAAAPAFYALLSAEQRAAPIGERVAAWARAGRLDAGDFQAAWRELYGVERPGRLPEELRIVRGFAAGDPRLDSIGSDYRRAMDRGDFVLFAGDWLVAESPKASIAILDAYAKSRGGELFLQPGGLRARYLFSGNWTTAGASGAAGRFFYRNAFFFRIDYSELGRLEPGKAYSIAPSGLGASADPDLRIVFE